MSLMVSSAGLPRRGDAARVVVITGGSSGIGRCTAALFARRGWRVGLIARGAKALAASQRDVEEAGARCATAQADVSDGAALAAAADAISQTLGPIDLWINCAGNGVYGRFGDVTEREFQRVTDVTYHGTVNGTRVALARMSREGTIINVCSGAAFYGLPLMSSYAGAKAAVRAFGQSVRAELAIERRAIRVVTVFPPAVNTPYFCHATTHMGWPARPARPVYQPEIVAQAIWQASISRRPEVAISGTIAVFSLATRLVPGVIAWCMQRLGMDGQLTRDSDVRDLHDPNLFTPSERVIGVHGPFGRYARGWSTHLWLDRQRTRFAKLFVVPPRGETKRPDVPSLSKRVQSEPRPGHAGLDEQPGAF